MNYKSILTLFALFYLFIQTSFSQTYADKDFYLIDSLILDDLHVYDREVIDSMLQLYHSEKDDTIKFGHIEQIIENSWNDAVTSRYNNYLYESVNKCLKERNNLIISKKLAYFKAVTLGNKGYYFDVESQFDSAKFYYEKAYLVFEEINHYSGMGNALYQIALIYKVQGNTVSAIAKFKEAADLCEKVKDYKGLAANYRSVGDILADVSEYGEAKESYRKAITFAKKADDQWRVGVLLNDLAFINLHQGQPDKAIKYCDSALVKMKAINYKGGIANIMNTFVSCYLEKNDNEKAFEYAKKGLETAKQIENNELLQLTYNNLSKIELNRAHYSEALKYALNAEELIEKTNSTSYEKNTINNLAQIYKKLGKYKLANKMLERKANLDYKIFNDEIRSAVIKSSYQNKYEQQKEIDDLQNQQKLDLAEEQKQKTRLGLIAAAIIAGLIALFSIFIFNRLKLIRKQKKKLDNAYEQLEESKKNELAVSNLKALQSQMNPHFIFNALNSVQDLVLLQDIRNSNKYLGKFSDLIRKILLSSKEQFITLEEEVEILSLYLDLEKLRFGEDFVIDLQCNVSEKQQDEIMLPAMFIQPYIENAIKHGLFHKEGKKELMVHFNIKNNALECIIKDNGIGQKKAAEFKQKRLHLHTGFSTEAINERIRLLNQTSDQKIELEVEDLFENEIAVGTKITLHFPI